MSSTTSGIAQAPEAPQPHLAAGIGAIAFVVQKPCEQRFGAAQFESFVQVPRHLPLVPAQRYGAHVGDPSLPSASNVHVPTEPATLQTSHGPAQPSLQQTPSEQLFEVQLRDVVHP